MDLFDFPSVDSKNQSGISRPLAEILRPEKFDDFFTTSRTKSSIQQILKTMEKSGRLPNLILWGPPGTGKTTLALLFSSQLPGSHFIQVNAVDTGAKKLKEIGQKAKDDQRVLQQKTILFIDEIHRLNKAQQDVLLPFTESGSLSLIGATTENPGYELNAALLSRSRVITLEPHQSASLLKILKRTESYLRVSFDQALSDEALNYLMQYSDGDGRKFINALEQVAGFYEFDERKEPVSLDELKQFLQQNTFHYDKASDQHYDTISAFIKSVRGSDPDAAVYYLARMLSGGEDPKFIARRLVILASEDIGNADPRALSMATSGFLAVEKVGLPEAAITLSQVTCYLASCPKSNRSYEALKQAQKIVQETGHLPIPKALRSAQTRFAKEQGYGEGYAYSHEGKKGYIEQQFLPDEIANEKFYEPTQRGFEKNISDYLDWMKNKG